MISTGCYSDNQNIISKADFLVGNPAPITRDFRGNNARHKVLMGVIDSGVDYNHPLLSNNIHFKLDPPGTPRARVDFIMMTAGPLLSLCAPHSTIRRWKLNWCKCPSPKSQLSTTRQSRPGSNLLSTFAATNQEYLKAPTTAHVAGLMTTIGPTGLMFTESSPATNADPDFDADGEVIQMIPMSSSANDG